MTGAQIFTEMIKRNGVKHIFGYPGGAILPGDAAVVETVRTASDRKIPTWYSVIHDKRTGTAYPTTLTIIEDSQISPDGVILGAQRWNEAMIDMITTAKTKVD